MPLSICHPTRQSTSLATALMAIAGFAVAITLAPAAKAQTSQPAPQAAAAHDVQKSTDALPIRRITLYRSGVASFQRQGTVNNDETVQLRFSTDQINDILKSMIVLDLSGNGRVGTIGFASREPLSRKLASFGVDLSDNPTLSTIASRLRGSPLTLQTPDASITGTVVGVENRTEYDTETKVSVAIPYVNVLTATGIRAVNLNKVTNFTINDPKVQAELNMALTTLAEHRADRNKAVDIAFEGKGEREVAVAYVQEAPVWKTSYRLVLPDEKLAEKEADKALTLQGWAIVENTTDEDWNDVTLALVSGRPVSFQMDLYEPLFLSRPMLPVPTVPGVMSRAYSGGRPGEPGKPGDPESVIAGLALNRAPGSPAPSAAPTASMRARAGAGGGGFADSGSGGETGAGYNEKRKYAGMNAADMSGGLAASASGEDAGSIFQFEIDHPVTVERQRSAMLPIISAPIGGRRVSIWSQSDGSPNPMRGVELKNNSSLDLMPGPISVFDNGVYAGDAQIGHVPRNATRLLAFAVDLDVAVQQENSYNETATKVKINRGVLEVVTALQSRSKLFFVNSSDTDRTMVAEVTRVYDLDDKAEPKPSEITDGAYRFTVAVPPKRTNGGKAELNVVQSRVESRAFGLMEYDQATLVSFCGTAPITPAVRKAFETIAAKKQTIADLNAALTRLSQERDAITADQTRIRENIKSIDRQSDLSNRYLTKLNEQEARLEAISTETTTITNTRTTAQNDLNAYIANLSIDN